MDHSMEVLQPYFKLRKATGRTFHRSDDGCGRDRSTCRSFINSGRAHAEKSPAATSRSVIDIAP